MRLKIMTLAVVNSPIAETGRGLNPQRRNTYSKTY